MAFLVKLQIKKIKKAESNTNTLIKTQRSQAYI